MTALSELQSSDKKDSEARLGADKDKSETKIGVVTQGDNSNKNTKERPSPKHPTTKITRQPLTIPVENDGQLNANVRVEGSFGKSSTKVSTAPKQENRSRANPDKKIATIKFQATDNFRAAGICDATRARTKCLYNQITIVAKMQRNQPISKHVEINQKISGLSNGDESVAFSEQGHDPAQAQTFNKPLPKKPQSDSGNKRKRNMCGKNDVKARHDSFSGSIH